MKNTGRASGTLTFRNETALVRRIAAALVIFAGLYLTHTQLEYWQNSETLWRHTLAVTRDNAVAFNNLGTALARQGKFREAISCFEHSVELQPGDATGQFCLGNALKDFGQAAQAESRLSECLRLSPEFPGAENALGVALAMLGRLDDAITHLSKATQQNPQDISAWYNLGTTLAGQGKFEEAIPALTRVVSSRPKQSSAHAMLGWAQYETGDLASARRHYRESLQLDPSWITKTNQQAWMLATNAEVGARNGARALQLARRICQATDFRRPDFLDTLAAAYAETGRFPEAMSAVDSALKLLMELNAAADQQAALKSRLELYQRHEAFRRSKP